MVDLRPSLLWPRTFQQTTSARPASAHEPAMMPAMPLEKPSWRSYTTTSADSKPNLRKLRPTPKLRHEATTTADAHTGGSTS